MIIKQKKIGADKQRQTETDKNQANAKQRTEAELLLFENYSHC